MMTFLQWPLVWCALVAANLVVMVYPPLATATQAETSQCIQCHTNLKKLIRLCWDVEALKPKDRQSAETSGEG
jgi:hypothetical protein